MKCWGSPSTVISSSPSRMVYSVGIAGSSDQSCHRLGKWGDRTCCLYLFPFMVNLSVQWLKNSEIPMMQMGVSVLPTPSYGSTTVNGAPHPGPRGPRSTWSSPCHTTKPKLQGSCQFSSYTSFPWKHNVHSSHSKRARSIWFSLKTKAPPVEAFSRKA